MNKRTGGRPLEPRHAAWTASWGRLGLFVLFTSARAFRSPSLSFLCIGQSQRSSTAVWQQQHQQQQYTTTSSYPHGNSKRKQLKWIYQGLEKESSQDTNLLESMEALVTARNPQQVASAGRLLESWWRDNNTNTSIFVTERVAKAAAMTGLHSLALDLVCDRTVSYTTQDAICSSLRQAGKIQLLQDTVINFGKCALVEKQSMSIASFNIMLAAMCDAALDKSIDRQKTTTLRTASRAQLLHRASDWLLKGRNETLARLNIDANAVSFATVYKAAAVAGNETLASALWNEMEGRKIRPNIFAYNARLSLLSKKGKAGDKATLDLWGTICRDPKVQPDRYSINLILPSLVRTQRFEKVDELLNPFVIGNSNAVVSDAFMAFLLTLTNAGELSAARRLFDVYMLPSLQPVYMSAFGSIAGMIKPTAGHFNVLLDACRRKIDETQAKTPRDTTVAADFTEIRESLRRDAWELYGIMQKPNAIDPDAHTFTIMMGICRDSEELTNLILEMQPRSGHSLVDFSTVSFRAMLTNYGRVGDAASVCWLFANFAAVSSNLRVWNVFLGSLSSCAKRGSGVICLEMASVGRVFAVEAKSSAAIEFSSFVENTTSIEVAGILLKVLANKHTLRDVRLPEPDSQFFCLLASILQHGTTGADVAMEVFRATILHGIPADGRFVNAILRCFGGEIKSALLAWKSDIRKACLAHERRTRSSPPSISRSKGKNLIAAYNGLLYVAGRSRRPDIGLRIVYAMQKEGLEPDETSMNCYNAGKEEGDFLDSLNPSNTFQLARKLRHLLGSYESLLYVECMKYDQNDKRRVGDKRVKIILQ